ncbi:MAG: Transposase DDE domain-containing protein, partial [Candidatus Kentron sp. G]
SHEQVTAQKILEPHYGATFKRIKEYPTVLCAQDTTELDYTSKKDIEGLGTLNYETRRGLYLHVTLAVTPQRLSLGQLDSWSWTRPFEDADKESIRWLEGYQRVSECQQLLREENAPTQLVYIADREGDIYDIFAEQKKIEERGQAAADWLIRAQHDRKTDEDKKLRALAEQATALGEIEFILPKGRDGSPPRVVVQTLRAVEVPLTPPKSGQPHVTVTAIFANEENPPKGEEPVSWLLLTNREVKTLAQAKEKLEWYLARWQIEIFFKVLKSGCRVEELQLEHIDRLEPALALYQIIAWRVLYLTMLGRECPQLPCDLIFSDDEWKSVYIVSTRQQPPEIPPTIDTMIRMVAGFGGFLNRKRDGFPGPQTVWVGLQRCRDFALMFEAQRE